MSKPVDGKELPEHAHLFAQMELEHDRKMYAAWKEAHGDVVAQCPYLPLSFRLEVGTSGDMTASKLKEMMNLFKKEEDGE